MAFYVMAIILFALGGVVGFTGSLPFILGYGLGIVVMTIVSLVITWSED
jgi:hypothetical protein